MEDDPNFFGNGRRPQFFENGRRPQFLSKWKTALKKIIKRIMLPETLKIKTMVVAPLRVT